MLLTYLLHAYENTVGIFVMMAKHIPVGALSSHTVSPMKYAQGFVVVCFFQIISSVLKDSFNTFKHIDQVNII